MIIISGYRWPEHKGICKDKPSPLLLFAKGLGDRQGTMAYGGFKPLRDFQFGQVLEKQHQISEMQMARTGGSQTFSKIHIKLHQ